MARAKKRNVPVMETSTVLFCKCGHIAAMRKDGTMECLCCNDPRPRTIGDKIEQAAPGLLGDWRGHVGLVTRTLDKMEDRLC